MSGFAAFPAAKVDLPAGKYPFTVMALDSLTREEVWRHVVSGPGALWIPPLARITGRPIAVRIQFADGTEIVQEPGVEPSWS